MAIGLRTSGSAANTSTWNPGGTLNPRAASSAGMGLAALSFSVSNGVGNLSAAVPVSRRKAVSAEAAAQVQARRKIEGEVMADARGERVGLREHRSAGLALL